MDKYEVDFSYTTTLYDTIETHADDANDAEDYALTVIPSTYPEASNIKIEMVKKINV